MGDLVMMPGVKPAPHPKPERLTVGLLCNGILAALIVGIGIAVVAIGPGVFLAWSLELDPITSAIVSAAVAVPFTAWCALILVGLKKSGAGTADQPPDGFHDAGETCEACGGGVWTPDDEGGPPQAA